MICFLLKRQSKKGLYFCRGSMFLGHGVVAPPLCCCGKTLWSRAAHEQVHDSTANYGQGGTCQKGLLKSLFTSALKVITI